ncbi:serine hydrolase [Gramella sp. KN1008]|uniref:serine hydrolase n=1 Tax=Gramella sp. KN1008 TaxID=2529298 RepID=UPI00103C9887|nr:serine hydrolase [Gramella sp. KN1008]TBW27540.1 serine hydrolase [Gramella sp. KN1008]
MRTGIFSFLFIFLVAGSALAQKPRTDVELDRSLEQLTRDFNGTVGVYVYNLETRQEAGINSDSIFPTASIVKVPILAGLFDKIAKGEFTLNDTLVYEAKRAYGGSGLMQFYKDSTVTDLRTLAALMITYSDNTTALWCQELAGGGEDINEVMKELGFRYTRVNSRTKGREEDWKKYGWGQTTPREMASLLFKIYDRQVVNPASSDEMYRMLTNSFYTDYALSQIPPYVQTAAKQGMVDRSRSELVMVNAPNGDYVFYIATKGNKDNSWDFDNEAWKLHRKISAFLWNYFEPDSDWKPASGSSDLVRGLRY